MKWGETNGRDNIQVVTGSDAFILTNPTFDKRVNISNPSGKEFRLTITIAFEEFRQPSQQAGSLWLEYLLGRPRRHYQASKRPCQLKIPVQKKLFLECDSWRSRHSLHRAGQYACLAQLLC